MNADAKLQTDRSASARIMRWVRYVCLTALALLVGYVSRDWTRSPIWRKELPLYTMIAGVSEARNEIVLLTQYDHASKPISGTPIKKRKKNDSAKRAFIAYESVPVAELEFSSPRNGSAVIPSTITIETRELSSGQVIKSLTINADNIYSVAGVDERTVTLAHVLGGILQVDRSNGATVTNQSFLGHCLLSPTGEYWANHQNIFATRSGDAIYQFSEGIQSGYGIGGLTWSPDGNKLAFSISTEPDPFNPGSKGIWISRSLMWPLEKLLPFSTKAALQPLPCLGSPGSTINTSSWFKQYFQRRWQRLLREKDDRRVSVHRQRSGKSPVVPARS